MKLFETLSITLFLKKFFFNVFIIKTKSVISFIFNLLFIIL